MKWLLPFLILFTSNLSGQTKFKGKFCTTIQPYARCMIFKKGHFYYQPAGCLDRDYGVGQYIATEDSLILKFKAAKGLVNSTVQVIDSNRVMNNDSSKVHILIVDEKDKPLPYTPIAVLNDSGFEKFFVTDSTGEVTFSLDNSHVHSVFFNSISMVQASQQLDSGMSYNLKALLIPKQCKNKLSGQVYSYKIIQIDKDSFKTIETSSFGTFESLFYRSKKRK